MSITNIIRIPNIEQYTLEMIHGELILTPRILEENAMEVTEKELLSYPLHDSTVVQCTIKSGDILISNKTKYRSILTDIWSSMPTQRILQTTTFNMRLENQRGLHGYNGVVGECILFPNPLPSRICPLSSPRPLPIEASGTTLMFCTSELVQP